MGHFSLRKELLAVCPLRRVRAPSHRKGKPHQQHEQALIVTKLQDKRIKIFDTLRESARAFFKKKEFLGVHRENLLTKRNSLHTTLLIIHTVIVFLRSRHYA